MKNLILLIAVMVLSACATTSTMKSVAGTYELKKDGDTYRGVLLENGISEGYINGKKYEEGKWRISKEGEMHLSNSPVRGSVAKGYTEVCRINKDGSITLIAVIPKDGKRTDIPKENQFTSKKIK